MQKSHSRAVSKVDAKVKSTRFIRSMSDKRGQKNIDKDKKVQKYLAVSLSRQSQQSNSDHDFESQQQQNVTVEAPQTGQSVQEIKDEKGLAATKKDTN